MNSPRRCEKALQRDQMVSPDALEKNRGNKLEWKAKQASKLAQWSDEAGLGALAMLDPKA